MDPSAVEDRARLAVCIWAETESRVRPSLPVSKYDLDFPILTSFRYFSDKKISDASVSEENFCSFVSSMCMLVICSPIEDAALTSSIF